MSGATVNSDRTGQNGFGRLAFGHSRNACGSESPPAGLLGASALRLAGDADAGGFASSGLH
jgi:hypothetical protein